jgi:transcriptional regulator with XRE-family HTH domain
VADRHDMSMSQIAGRIRDWRTGANMTLQNLADRSSVSPSTIHKIENGQSIPTITVLFKLAGGLGRRPAELLEDDAPTATISRTAPHELPIVVTDRGTRIEWLVDGLSDPIVDVWRVTYPTGFSTGSELIRDQEGEFIILCEDGELAVQVGEEHLRLVSGDSVHFKANRPFRWRNAGTECASAIVIGAMPSRMRGGLVERLSRLRESRLPTAQ